MKTFKSLFALIAVCAIILILCLHIKEANTVDLRAYMPTNASLVYVNGNGDVVSSQVWDTKPYSGKYKKLWSTAKKGCHIRRWGKYAFVGDSFDMQAIQPMLLCKDKSVTELGGYRDGKVIKYTKNDEGSGLYWAGRGGLGYNPVVNEVEVSGNKAYSRSRLLYQVDSFNVRGTDYTDVIVMMFEHGTTNAKKVTCPGVKSFKDYNSYISIFWMARGVGVIQQIVVSIEDGKTYWGGQNCIGNKFSGGESFTTYLQR